MLNRIESLNRLARVVLVCGLALLVSAAGHPGHAQPLRTLQVQDGKVYIDSKQVPADQLPASLDLAGVTMQFQFMGDVDPVIALGDRLYRVEGEHLLEVGQADQPAASVDLMLDMGAGPPLRFPQAFTVPLATPFSAAPVTLEGALAENTVIAMGQEILQAQAFALEQLVREIEQQNRLEGTLDGQGAVRPVRIGQAPLLRQPLQGMDPLEAALMTEKLRYQAERMEMAARQLPQIEIRSYLDEIQQHDAELYDRLLREQLLEEESLHLAARVRQAPEGRERTARVAALRSKLDEIFELKQENRRREIEQLRDQLGELQRHLDERERLHQHIIENRIQELTGLPPSQE